MNTQKLDETTVRNMLSSELIAHAQTGDPLTVELARRLEGWEDVGTKLSAMSDDRR